MTLTDDILITTEWLNNCSKLDINLFNEFKLIYNNYTGKEETVLTLAQLQQRLDSLGVASNTRLGKLYNCLYDIVTYTSSKVYAITIITGFFDATEFIIGSNGSIDNKCFAWSVIKHFLNCGGIVRIDGKDYLPYEEKVVWSIIKKKYNL